MITGVLLDRKDAGGRYFSRFYSRRARRILVPCALLMLISSILFGTGWLREWYWYALFASNVPQIFHPGSPTSLGILWSLSVEEQFYVVWPLVLLAPRNVAVWMAGALTVAAPILRGVCTPLFSTNYPIYYLTPFRMDLLACGALTCFVFRSRPERIRSLSSYAEAAVVVGVAAVILHRFGILRTTANTVFSNVFVFEITLLISWALLIAALDDESWLTRILRIRWLRGIGIISYSMYLIHLTMLSICRQHLHNPTVIVFLTFAGTIVYSALSWRFIESNLLQQRRGRGAQQQAAAAKL